MKKSVVNKPAILYMARNKITDDFYIGVTSFSLEKRRIEHLRLSRRGKRNKFYNAIRKYHEDNFIWTKIGGVESYKECLELEMHLIKKMSPKYNTSKGGDGNLGYTHSEETRKKISAAVQGPKPWLVGRKLSAAHKKRLSERSAWKGTKGPSFGMKHSEETRKKLSIAGIGRIPVNKGKKMSDEFRRNTSLGHMGQIPWNRKKVICIEDGKIFNRLKDAAEFYNIPVTTLAEICQGRRKNKDLLIYKYLEDENVI